jgi:tRNA-dihydrouridine synthase
MTDILNPKQIEAMSSVLDRVDAAQEEPRFQELRQALILDYLEADAEESENRGAADQYEHMLVLGQKFAAARALSRYLVKTGEYPTVEAAADAIERRAVRGMPKPGVDYSKVVPF